MSVLETAASIKDILDDQLDVTKLSSRHDGNVAKGAIEVLQKIFVQELEFDPIGGTFRGLGERIPTDTWNQGARVIAAYIIAEAKRFRIAYVQLEKLTRTSERHAISSLKSEGWAREGEYIAVFHAPDSEVWHLVSPYMSEGRTILRRYIVGYGEKHRTVSSNLAKMDAAEPELLHDRVNEAFRVQTVTEQFYGHYKEIYAMLKEYLFDEGLEVSDAKRFSHLLLNRLMFLYFLQKKGWLAGRKNFVRWFLDRYKSSSECDCFHGKWLNTLFFKAMNEPSGSKTIEIDLPEAVSKALQSIPFMNGGLFDKQRLDNLGMELPDELIMKVIEEFLENYNFTVTEESAFDVDMAVDPAMLGRIYESLIAEEERGEAGIFYTPRIEVDFMCRAGMFEFLREASNGERKKKQRSALTDDEIITFLFTPIERWSNEDRDKYNPASKLMQSAKIVDPACGSGAFLVGMMQILTELHWKCGEIPDYDLKESILHNNLYGVDIKDWAVRMAELRLWLALIESQEKIPEKEPVLPNFSFKLRCGDSIVQKIGNKVISLKEIRDNPSEPVRQRLDDLNALVERFFFGEDKLMEEIQEKQLEIVQLQIENEISRLQEQTKTLQVGLDGEITAESKQVLEQVQAKVDELESTKDNLESAIGPKKIIWDLDFPEVMMNGGFDIVIANPPYVRHEGIISQSIDPEDIETYDSKKVDKLKKQYKGDLLNYARKYYGKNMDKRSDLYVYFFIKALELLRDNGHLIFISSNSWLDVDFGEDLQEILLRSSFISYIIDSNAKRSFESSAINTVITIAKKTPEELLARDTCFLMFKKAYEDLMTENQMRYAFLGFSPEKEITIHNENVAVQVSETMRRLVITEESLWHLGDGATGVYQEEIGSESETKAIPKGDYSGEKWGQFLRAPDVFFKILHQAGDKLTKVGDIAEIKRGYTTGANDFFYLPAPGESSRFFEGDMDSDTGDLLLSIRSDVVDDFVEQGFQITEPMFQIEKEYWMHPVDEPKQALAERIYENEDGLWIPNAIVTKSEEVEKYQVDPSSLTKVVLLIEDEFDKLQTGVQEYIKWGEKWQPSRGNVYHERPTCNSRPLWYELGYQLPQDMILLRFRYLRNWTPILTDDTKVGDIVFAGRYENQELSATYDALLNSTFHLLTTEVLGRINLGEGLLTTYGPEIKDSLILNPESLSKESRTRIHRSFESMMPMQVGTIFEELGVSIPENTNEDTELNVDLDKINKHRYAIDREVFDVFGLSRDEQLQVYQGLVELIWNRIRKAESV